jgi:hypothetical protein
LPITRRPGIDPLDADGLARAHQRAQRGRGRGRPVRLARADPGPRGDEARGDRGAHLVDGLQPVGQVHAAGELVEDRRPLGGDDQVARRVARVEDLHVARAGGVADVHRVEQQAGRDAAPRHLGAHPAQPVGPDRHHVDAALDRLAVEKGELGQLRPLRVPVQLHRAPPSALSPDSAVLPRTASPIATLRAPPAHARGRPLICRNAAQIGALLGSGADQHPGDPR